MGLPMFRDPDEVAVEEATAKLDRAAAARRSSIRREPTVRPGRYGSPSLVDRIRDGRREQSMLRTRALVHEDEREANQQIAQLEIELERLRSIRMRYRTRLDRQMSHANRGSRAHGEALLEQLESMSPLPQLDIDPITGNVTASPETTSSHLPRPPRESGLRFEFAASSRSRSTSPRRYYSSRRPTIPSPPYSSGVSHRERLIEDGSLPVEDRLSPALTPGFAPAHGVHRDTLQPSQNEAEAENNTSNNLTARLQTPPPDTPPYESWEATYPPLRRVSHLSPRPLGVSSRRIDGLGDRRRSPSPLSDTQEEVTWANLLTTMDTQRSSTATSFASTRSDSVLQSNRSSQNTATSFGEIGQADDTCDLDLPSGITEEDVREIRAQHRYMRRRQADRPVMTGERGLRENRERRARRLEISMFQNILERMQRREDIPDDWWAAVGLSPDVVRGNASI